MHHSLYLLAVDPDQRANAVLAVRWARQLLNNGRDRTDSTAAATDIVQQVLDGKPALIGRHAEERTVQAAAAVFNEARYAASCVVAVDPTPEQIIVGEVPPPAPAQNVEAEAANKPCAPEAYETAMVLLVALDGNPFSAWSIARSLGRTTRSKGFEEVQRAILRVFPPDPNTAQIIEHLRLDDGDGE
jgi:hypothetical protein